MVAAGSFREALVCCLRRAKAHLAVDVARQREPVSAGGGLARGLVQADAQALREKARAR